MIVCLCVPLAAQQISYKLRNKVEPGTKPAVILVTGESLKQVSLVLTRDDGKEIRRSVKRPKIGKEIEFAFPQKAGKRHYKAKIEMLLADGRVSTAETDFDVVVAAEVDIQIDWNRSGLAEKTIESNGVTRKIIISGQPPQRIRRVVKT